MATKGLTVNDVTPDWIRTRGISYQGLGVLTEHNVRLGTNAVDVLKMSDNVIRTSIRRWWSFPRTLFARVDFAKYRSGAATMRNFFRLTIGAALRPDLVLNLFDRLHLLLSTLGLVRFQQSTKVTYILEFGNFYLRFSYCNGSSVVNPAAARLQNIYQCCTGQVTVSYSGFINNE